MSATAKSVLSAGVALALSGAILGGVFLRDKVESSGVESDAMRFNAKDLVASRLSDAPDGDGISEVDYFSQMVELLKREYVDPINDDRKLASGAIKGMINSLQNPDCLFMYTDQFRAYLNARDGKYEGIGVDLVYDIPAAAPKTRANGQDQADPSANNSADPKLPNLVVADVVPGGPADKAGIKPGDVISDVDGHWVLNPESLAEFRDSVRKANDNKTDAAQASQLRNELQIRIKTSTMPAKAKDKLILGKSGEVSLAVRRNGQLIAVKLNKAVSQFPLVAKTGNAISVRFLEGAADRLKSEVGESKEVTLDLRNNCVGDFSAMRECMAVLAPSGKYGTIANEKHAQPKSLVIAHGSVVHRKIHLLVDGSTRGIAEVFALALSSNGAATLEGPPMSDDRNIEEIVQLPGGTGYTLVVGQYRSSKGGAA